MKKFVNKKTLVRILVMAAIFTLMMGIVVLAGGENPSGSGGSAGASTAIKAVAKILQLITAVVGGILLLVGIVRFVLAHTQEDGPNQQKAAMMIAAAIAILVLSGALSSNALESIIGSSNLDGSFSLTS